jgi:hypothetical protein
VVDVASLQWAPDPTSEVPELAGLPDAPTPDEPSDGAPPSDRPWDQTAAASSRRGADDTPVPGASVFAPDPAAGDPRRPGPPGPPASHPPQGRGWPQISPVILGLVALGGLLVLGLAVLVLRGDDDGSDTPEGSEASPADIDDLGEGASLVVGPTGLLGMWSGSEWVPRSDGGDQPGAGIELDVIGLGEVITSAVGEAGDPVAESCASNGDRGQDVRVPVEPGGLGGPPPVAVAGVADPLPRPVEHFEGSETYQEPAADVARGEGMTTPPTVSHVLRMDLDGTGTDEVLVVAEHLSDPEGLTPSSGDWSMVFLRWVVGNDVETAVVASSHAAGDDTLEHIRVSAVADLNDDGTMEVVLSGRSASGDWTAVHAAGEGGVTGGLSEVLRTACGV